MRWIRLGDYITQRREKNNNLNVPILGVTRDGFIPPKQEEANTSLYNVFYKYDFVFNPARMELNSIYLNMEYDKAICYSLYEIFYVNNPNELLPEYLNLFIKRGEFARFCWYDAVGSARNYFRVANMQDIMIPLPSLNTQRELVATWKGLRVLKEQNEAIAEPLFQLCQSYIQKLKHNCKKEKLEKYIEEINTRNTDDKFGVESLRGVTSDGNFDNTKAKTEGLNFTNYKVIKHNQFAYNPSRINIGSIALNLDKTAIISPMYVAFQIKSEYSNVLLSEYLNIWFQRPEFQRSTLFYASGSTKP